MSHHVAFNQISGCLDSPDCGKFWYVLRDKGGKVRDWINANSASHARERFRMWHFNNQPFRQGYTVERRGPVE